MESSLPKKIVVYHERVYEAFDEGLRVAFEHYDDESYGSPELGGVNFISPVYGDSEFFEIDLQEMLLATVLDADWQEEDLEEFFAWRFCNSQWEIEQGVILFNGDEVGVIKDGEPEWDDEELITALISHLGLEAELDENLNAPFRGNPETHKFHSVECRHCDRQVSKVPFRDGGAAKHAGYEPCKACVE